MALDNRPEAETSSNLETKGQIAQRSCFRREPAPRGHFSLREIMVRDRRLHSLFLRSITTAHKRARKSRSARWGRSQDEINVTGHIALANSPRNESQAPDEVGCHPVYPRIAAGLPERKALNRGIFVDEDAQVNLLRPTALSSGRCA